MATDKLQIILDAIWRGKGNVQRAQKDINGLDRAARMGDKALVALGTAAGVAGAAVAAVGVAAKVTWDTLGKGAALSRSRDQFDRLTTSIESTSDAMLGRLRQATQGMVSDAELISSAGQIMSLGLADTEDGVVRLANLVSQLGWDMQQVIMTFANNSKMRLDALGLSVTDVEEKMKALQASGMSMDAAFDMAVIQAGEEKLKLLGSAADTAEGRMKQLQTAFENANNAMAESVAINLAEDLDRVTTSVGELDSALDTLAMTAAGAITIVGQAFAAVGFAIRDLKGMATILQNGELGELFNFMKGFGARGGLMRDLMLAFFGRNMPNPTSIESTAPGMQELERKRAINQSAEARNRITTDYDQIIEKSNLANNIQIRNARQTTEATEQLGYSYENLAVSQDVAANMMATFSRAGEEQAEVLTGVGGAAIQTADAMDQLAAATGAYFLQAQKSTEFNPFQTALEAAAGMGANAWQLSQFGIAGGLFSQDEATGFMNEAFMRQQAEGMIAEMIAAGDAEGAAALTRALEQGLADGEILAQEFFQGLDAGNDVSLNLDTEEAKGEVDLLVDYAEGQEVTIKVNWDAAPLPQADPVGTPVPAAPAQFGGPVSAGTPYWVGEGGRELFVPKQDGTIMPHHSAGGSPIVINTYTKEAAAVAMTMAWQQRRGRF